MFKTIADKMLLIGMVAVLAVNGMADTVQPAYAELNNIPGTTQIMTNTVEYVQSAVGDISMGAITGVVEDIIDERFGTAQFVPMSESGSVNTNLSFETNITFKSKVDFTQSSTVSFGNGMTVQGDAVFTNGSLRVNGTTSGSGIGPLGMFSLFDPTMIYVGNGFSMNLPQYFGTIATNVVNGAAYLPATYSLGYYEVDSFVSFNDSATFYNSISVYGAINANDGGSISIGENGNFSLGNGTLFSMYDATLMKFGDGASLTNLPTFIDNRISSAMSDVPQISDTTNTITAAGKVYRKVVTSYTDWEYTTTPDLPDGAFIRDIMWNDGTLTFSLVDSSSSSVLPYTIYGQEDSVILSTQVSISTSQGTTDFYTATFTRSPITSDLYVGAVALTNDLPNMAEYVLTNTFVKATNSIPVIRDGINSVFANRDVYRTTQDIGVATNYPWSYRVTYDASTGLPPSTTPPGGGYVEWGWVGGSGWWVPNGAINVSNDPFANMLNYDVNDNEHKTIAHVEAYRTLPSDYVGKIALTNDVPNLTNTYVEIAKDSSANTQSAIAIGENASAQSPRSISIGHSSTAESVTGQDNFDTIAIGSSSVARLTSAIAIGNGAIASNSCAVAIGKGSKSRSNAAVALGCDANASGGVAISIGNRTQATNTNGIAIGDCAEAGGRLGVALGGKSTAPAIAKGARTVQIGIGTNTVADSFQFNQANLFIARANDQGQSPETVARLGNGFPKANTSRLGAVTVDGTTIGADPNGQISVLSTPAKKYALFIIPYEPGTGWTSIELKGSKENFSSGGYGDFCYLYNTGITVSGWDSQYDNGISFLTCQTLGQDMRKWTKVVTSTDNITGGYIITNNVSEIAILVGEPLLVAHGYETISENDESINWSYTRFSATGREINSSGYVIWHPVMPVRWYKSLPSWANQ